MIYCACADKLKCETSQINLTYNCLYSFTAFFKGFNPILNKSLFLKGCAQ